MSTLLDESAAQPECAAAVPPRGREPCPADKTHMIVYCMLVYTTRTCSNDVRAALRVAGAAPQGGAFRGERPLSPRRAARPAKAS